MSVPPEQIDIIRQWVVKAENDHKAFQNLLKMGDDCPFDVVCFLAQQCAEKYLKARLVYLSIDFPKIHDISEIVKLFPPGFGIPLSPTDQTKLTKYAWIGRYPGNWEPMNHQDAKEAAELASKVRTALRSSFPKEVLR
jgi:HEPN domain-containing protein